MSLEPVRFICESITVYFDKPPLLEKKPGCPDEFVWRGKRFRIQEKLGEWHDYSRRGRMAKNMLPTHAATAKRKGSWGVGQDYFQVRTTDGRIFEIFFDRAPKDASQRKGAWFIYRELSLSDLP